LDDKELYNSEEESKSKHFSDIKQLSNKKNYKELKGLKDNENLDEYIENFNSFID
ncbi:1658_t:CDS:1, partial [Dentiscutata heterogama]